MWLRLRSAPEVGRLCRLTGPEMPTAAACSVRTHQTRTPPATHPPLPKEWSWSRMQSTHERFLGWKYLSKSLQGGFLGQYLCAGVGPAASGHTVPPRAAFHLRVARGLLRGVTGVWHPLEQRLSELRELLLAATPAFFLLTYPLVYDNLKAFLPEYLQYCLSRFPDRWLLHLPSDSHGE